MMLSGIAPSLMRPTPSIGRLELPGQIEPDEPVFRSLLSPSHLRRRGADIVRKIELKNMADVDELHTEGGVEVGCVATDEPPVETRQSWRNLSDHRHAVGELDSPAQSENEAGVSEGCLTRP